ncbi:MAG: metallophosphoesterase [Proteobacteria bacterium]|nr:metallophosphoesterase [Pseudomonadota bacterium]
MKRRPRRWLNTLGGVFLLGAGLLFYAIIIEPDRLLVREEVLSLPGWPSHLDGLKIAVISDLHAGAPHIDADKIRDVVAQTNAAHPDIILLPGDFVIQGVRGATYMPPEESAAILADLNAPLGVWAVIGNHDWWLSFDQVHDALEANGIRALENEATKIETTDGAFWLAGVGDAFVHQNNLE